MQDESKIWDDVNEDSYLVWTETKKKCGRSIESNIDGSKEEKRREDLRPAGGSLSSQVPFFGEAPRKLASTPSKKSRLYLAQKGMLSNLLLSVYGSISQKQHLAQMGLSYFFSCFIVFWLIAMAGFVISKAL